MARNFHCLRHTTPICPKKILIRFAAGRVCCFHLVFDNGKCLFICMDFFFFCLDPICCLTVWLFLISRFNTTLGQLNFFAWSIRYEVLDFCAKKQMEIKEHAKQQKKRKQLKREQKKSEVSTQQQTPPSQNNDQSDKTISMLMSNHPVKKKPKQTKATNNNMDMVNRQTIHETNVQSSLTDASLENKETRIPKRKKSIKSLSSKPKTQTTTSRKRSRIARNSFLLIQTQYTVEPQMEI